MPVKNPNNVKIKLNTLKGSWVFFEKLFSWTISGSKGGEDSNLELASSQTSSFLSISRFSESWNDSLSIISLLKLFGGSMDFLIKVSITSLLGCLIKLMVFISILLI